MKSHICHQRGNWRRIRKIFAAELLVSSVNIDLNGRVHLESVTWDQYWRSSVCHVPQYCEADVDVLRFAWAEYIRNDFDLHLAIPYCYAYFSLLHKTLAGLGDGRCDLAFLATVLGFECSPVRNKDEKAVLAAITFNVKHPAYLLAKIRTPHAYDDPKFLPLVTVNDLCCESNNPWPLFYHYRQLASGENQLLRLLIYPPVDTQMRPKAFRCIQQLCSEFANKHDTRIKQRSARIAELAVEPILERLIARNAVSKNMEVRIADLGAGTGDLTRKIIERSVARFPDFTKHNRFSWTLVDVGFGNIKRHAYSRQISQLLSNLRCERSDFIHWLERQPSSCDGKPFHIIFLCRLLNNASLFSIGWVDDWQQVKKLSNRELEFHAWQEGSYLPGIALRDGELFASNARIPLLRGSTYCQLSLSDYYRGLYLLSGNQITNIQPHAIFFPIRRFNESAFDLPSGGSGIEKLCSLGNVVVIEDVDLDASTLRRYLYKHNIQGLAASNVTDRSRMHTANLLCLAGKEDESLLPGCRIW